MKLRNTFISILLLHGILSYGQSREQRIPWQKKDGIIYFEKSGDVYSMYFIETSYTDLASLINAKDSVDVFSLQNSNCAANNIDGFISDFFNFNQYQTFSLLINAENHLGQHYEDSIMIYSMKGSIKYMEDLRYKMVPDYQKITLNNKSIIFVSRENI